MAKTRMPRDDNGASIQVLRYRPGGYHVVPIYSNTSSEISVAGGTRVITVYSTTDAWFVTGNSSITASANCHYLPCSTIVQMAMGSDLSDSDDYHTTISLRSTFSDGTVYISEMQ